MNRNTGNLEIQIDRSNTDNRIRTTDRVPPRAAPSKLKLILLSSIGSIASLFVPVSLAHAGELSAMAGKSLDLGQFHGVLYYTSEDDGYRVVATLTDGEGGLPLRFSTTLAENQSATISVPGPLGEPSQSVEIIRSGDTLTVSDVGSASDETSHVEKQVPHD